MRGVFISFEGIDGCGKSTQIARLITRLEQAGIEPLVVREPGGTALGERVRELLLDPATGDIAPTSEALLYAASRAELVATVIEPALTRGEIVIADRFIDSSIVYQGSGRGIGAEPVRAANMLATQGLLPDCTIFLRIDLNTSIARRSNEDDDRLEAAGSAFFARVAIAYDVLAQSDAARVATIDGSASPDEVHDAVCAALEPVLAPFLNGVSA